MAELTKISEQINKCKKCSLCKTRQNTVPGEGPADSKLFLVGEAPGRSEDETGRPFIGQSGRLLTQMLEEAGIDRNEVFITSVLKCRPPENRKPNPGEVEKCKPHLLSQINCINPKFVVLMGLVAIGNMIGDNKQLKEIHGQIIKQGDYNFFITYHPAAARRFKKFKDVMIQDFKKLKKLV